jgi:alkanesulfonate monooxygenase SsuD/methylene tetrahydromethanopterin reductase-like flavin-dependent oxidoreductase (luciferase family)
VYLSFGIDADAIADALAEVASGASEAGRSAPAAWWVVPFGIALSREAALRIVGPSLATLANHSLRAGSYADQTGTPDLRARLAEFHGRFDWSKKNVPGAERANVELMAETGVLDHLLDHYAVAGTPVEVVERLTALAARGVERVMLKVNSPTELELLTRDVLPRLP